VNSQGRGGDRHVYASRTRFIPDALAPHFDARTWPLCKEPIGANQGKPFNIDVAARLRQVWS
jgi:DNA helicase-2/ATP-dependent DNA helicase PcrA